jgi:putative nucleotidyltransferase with HDIG domain
MRKAWLEALRVAGVAVSGKTQLTARERWERLLMAEGVRPGLEVLQETGVLLEDFPEVAAIVGFGGGEEGHKDLWSHVKQVVFQTPAKAHLRWSALFHDVGKVKCFRRHEGKVSFHGHEIVSARLWEKAAKRTAWFTVEERTEIKFLVEHLGHVESYDSDWTDSAVRRVVREMGDHFSDLVALSRADMTTSFESKRRKNQGRIDELEARVAALAQADLRPKPRKGLSLELGTALGIEAGPELGRVMKAVIRAVEAGQLSVDAPLDEYVRWVQAGVP